MRKFAVILLMLACALAGYAQRTRKVTAEYIYYAPETMSIDEAKRTALDRAKIQAIADEFGTTVTQSNSTIISTRNGETDTKFMSYGGSDVKGEWIETTDEPTYDVRFEDHNIVVSVKVKGVIREISESKIDIIAKSLRNGTGLKFEATEFKDDDDLYLYFKSPVDGYLSVYMLDEASQTVFCMLPYSQSNGDAVAVEHDREYIFFSDEHKFSKEQVVDEYTLTCDGEKEYETLYILFSQKKIAKTHLNDGADETVPKNLSYGEFRRWLADLRKQSTDLTVVEIPISVEAGK